MTLLWFLVLIGPLVIVHELGHMIVARLLGIGVLSISFGVGRPLLRTVFGGTEWSVRMFPIGGYVRLLGEDSDEPVPEARRAESFATRPPWQRMAVILGGPLANVLLAVPLFFAITVHQETALASEIGTVFTGLPAAEADLRPGDRVVAVDGEPVRYWEELNQRLLVSPGRELKLTIERAGVEKPLEKYVRPREHIRPDAAPSEAPVGLIGIAPHRRLPQVGIISAQSPAGLAGMHSFDVVLAIQGRPAKSLADLDPLVNPHGGGMLVVSYVRPTRSVGFAAVGRLEPAVATVVPTLEPVLAVQALTPADRALVAKPRGHYDAGVRPADLFVYDIEVGSSAEGLGLHRGDLLLRLDDAVLTSWELFERALEERPTAEHQIVWFRPQSATVHQARFQLAAPVGPELGARAARFGAVGPQALEPGRLIEVDRRMPRALARAVERTGAVSMLIARTLLGVATHAVSASSIGGPLQLVVAAGKSAREGWTAFLAMAALVSLNLGLINLLPLPLLDGGQGALVIVEGLLGREVSLRSRRRATAVGLVLLVALFLFASWNDLTRLLGHAL